MYQYQARENLSIGAKRDLKKPICYENTVCQKCIEIEVYWQIFQNLELSSKVSSKKTRQSRYFIRTCYLRTLNQIKCLVEIVAINLIRVRGFDFQN